MTPDPSEALDRLAQEYVDRARRGEAPSIEEYATANPDLATEIRDLFPILAVVEELKTGSASGASAPSTQEGRANGWGGVRLPERVGPYRIVREIGRGGMGSVHEGRLEGDGDVTQVAIKVVHPHLLQNEEYVARFLREAEAGARIEHPSVVATYSTGLVDVGGEEIPYLVLEYVEGQNLRALLEEVEVVPERLCRLVAARLAEALAAVHAAGLVHRDVKPENVVITPDETVKLMDLGVAVLQEHVNRLSRTGEFIGSVLYAAPEQLVGEEPEPRWDLYSLGVTLYELATGRHPARGTGARWMAPGAPPRRVPAPIEVRPELSPFFDTLIQALLSAEADERPPSAEALHTILVEGERSEWWRTRKGREPRLASRLRGLDRSTRFYGRASEWKTIERLRSDTMAGRGRVLLVEGDAGIGKTRLVHEWLAAEQHTPSGPPALVASHDPGAVEGGEEGLATALLEYLGTANLEARLVELLGPRAPLAPPLARHLLGEAVEEGGRGLDPMTLDVAYAHLLRGLAGEREMVVVIEDLHFASAESRKRFLFLARALEAFPVLLIGTTRSVPTPTWAAELEGLPHVTSLRLEGLDTQACRSLVAEAAQSCTGLGDSVASLAERCDHNPYFLLELVRECARGPLAPDGGVSTEMQIPDTVRGVITSRLASLDVSDRELLEAAACCGHEFDPVLVAEAAGLGRIASLKSFGRLEREHGLLRPDQRNYRFQHHLLQEVLYAEIHPALKESYHAALGQGMEARIEAEGSTVSGPTAVALCTHFLEGNRPHRARRHVLRALRYLDRERCDFARSTALARRSLELDEGMSGEERAVALHVLAVDAVEAGRHEEAHTRVDEAFTLALQTGSSLLAIDLLRLRGAIHNGEDRVNEMREAYLASARRARSAKDPGREAHALSDLGLQLTDLGRADEGWDCLRRAFEALEGHDDPLREALITTNLARIEVHRHNLEEGERLLRRSQELAHSVGDMGTEVTNLLTLGQLAVRRGHFREALDYGQRSLDLGRRMGQAAMDVSTLSNLGYCLAELGRYDEAMERVNEAVARAGLGDVRLYVSHSRYRRGSLRMARGELEDARVDLEAACDLAEVVKRPDIVAATGGALASALAQCGRPEEAVARIERAVGLLGPKESSRMALARAEVAETRGELPAALEIYEKVRSRDGPGGLPAARLALAVGRTLLRLDETDAVRGLFEEAVEWGRVSGVVRLAVMAQVYLAALPGGDVLAARVLLEKNETGIPVKDRAAAHLALYEAEGDREHLDSAWRWVRFLRDHAPEDARTAVLEGVDLNRRVVEAIDGVGAE